MPDDFTDAEGRAIIEQRSGKWFLEEELRQYKLESGGRRCTVFVRRRPHIRPPALRYCWKQ